MKFIHNLLTDKYVAVFSFSEEFIKLVRISINL